MEPFVSYRFGVGRYLQEHNLLEVAGKEVARHGSRPYVIAGPKSLAATEGRLLASLGRAGLACEVEEYPGYPSAQKADGVSARIGELGCDVVVAVGGGRIMDLAKAVSFPLGLPIVAVPTSAATCAAFSPLSVMYTDGGAFDEYRHYDRELDGVLVDDALMAHQPPRLLAAGIMDAMAKYVEIANGKPHLTLEQDGIDKYSAWRMAGDVYEVLREHGPAAYEDVSRGLATKTMHDVVFACIALTGIVSAVMRAHGQTAVAHRLYEQLRTHYAAQSAPYLHGEIVATGLIAQLAYNGDDAGIEPLAAFMRRMGMPMTLRDLGLDGTDETVERLTGLICGGESVPDEPGARGRLRDALRGIA